MTGRRISGEPDTSVLFDGRELPAVRGEPLSAALLAAGVRTAAAGVRTGRPRGVVGIGTAEPGAQVRVEAPEFRALAPATGVEVRDGLIAASTAGLGALPVTYRPPQRGPSGPQSSSPITHDLQQEPTGPEVFPPVSHRDPQQEPAGPRPSSPAGRDPQRGSSGPSAFPVVAHRDLQQESPGGQASPSAGRTPPRGDARWAHCEVLVVGAGPAGLAAAAAAAQRGVRVILADEAPRPGGDALGLDPATDRWIAGTTARLADAPEVRLLTRTTVIGHYDHGELVALERRPDGTHLLWRIRARRTVLASGSVERPFAFAGNDLPGVMLAGAAAAYPRRHGVLPGERITVSGCHDEALLAAAALHDAGADIAAVADARPEPGADALAGLARRGIEVRTATAAAGTVPDGRGELAAALLAPVAADGTVTGPAERIGCDLLAVSGGHDPAAALAVQAGGRLRWSEGHAAFLPEGLPATTTCAGALTGVRSVRAAAEQGDRAGRAAAAAALAEGAAPAAMSARGAPPAPETGAASDTGTAPGAGSGSADLPPAGRSGGAEARTAPPMALFTVVRPGGDAAEVFIDLQRDAALDGVRDAVAAGMRSIEHVKRYTTAGTGPDQGRTSATVLTGALAGLLGRGMDEVGGTAPRPPCTPVPFSALAGRARGELLEPLRRTPMNAWHEEHGAVFEDVGQWRRARYYPRDGEDMRAAVLRECAAAREAVGMLDASTLGAITVAGRDAGAFLDRIYTGTLSTLRPGRCRYGVMCTADGMVLDDGVVARISEEEYLVSTTTGNAERVLEWLEEWAQTEWPHLCVHLFNATDHWAVASLVGPASRDVMRELAPDMDVSAEGFRFMSVREGTVAGIPARVLRVSFTGELTYEVNVPAWHGLALWEAAVEAGRRYGVTPYGTEAMHVLRAEKGFIVVGHETDGSVTPLDLGMDWAVAKRKEFVGKRSLTRPDTARPDREQLVGLLPEDPGALLAEGAQLVAEAPGPAGGGRSGPGAGRRGPGERIAAPIGRVTSAYDSAALGRTFALGLLRSGRERHGERLYAVHMGEAVPVRVADPVFYDREGSRRDG
ncbi:glycine cleavage T C-terminal barrel domain-containing protein [Nocardiopsis potens]|uniref:glycine cleavage T C-terminal barrel domain-containing protein n=1 Tax=Nocardiopsis potens TaxID=1246458 RepID=UPI0003485005|nr:glycine cleavage T C-terminal barrel domain-containing protein [Nocardiopsis potens]